VATTLDPATELAIRLDPSLLMELAGFEPDDWQRHALRCGSRRLLLLASRQSGKSECAGFLVLHEALFRPESLILLVSRSERQSGELFQKKVVANYNRLGRPIESRRELQFSLELSNGSRVVALPGDNPATIRCFSGVWMVVVDEAALCLDSLFTAVRPMLGTTDGKMVCLSTPFGRRGWFFEQWVGADPTWERIVSRAVDCPRISPEFLAEERRMLGPAMFSQEHECMFIESEGQVFSTESIEACFRGAEDVPILAGF
jgi:hypothetical protein